MSFHFSNMRVDFRGNAEKIEGITHDMEGYTWNGPVKVYIKEKMISFNNHTLEMKIKNDRVYVKTKYMWGLHKCGVWSVLIRKNPSKSYRLLDSKFFKEVEQAMLMHHMVDEILLGD